MFTTMRGRIKKTIKDSIENLLNEIKLNVF